MTVPKKNTVNKKVVKKKARVPKKTGAQFNNKNAEKWPEEEAVKLGEELINYMMDEGNYLFKCFLYFDRRIASSTICMLGQKFDSFRALIKEARLIQQLKIQDGMLKRKIDPTSGIWIGKTTGGYREELDKDLFDFERDTNQADQSFLTNAYQTTNVHQRTVEAICEKKNGKYKNRIILEEGGTRSSKSYSISQIINDGLLSGHVGERLINGHIGVYKQSLPFVKQTILLDIIEVFESKNLIPGIDINWNKTEHFFEKNGRRLYYGSINGDKEVNKVKGLGLGLILFDEANELPWNAFLQLNMRGRQDLIFILAYNPDDDESWVNTEIKLKRMKEIGDVAHIHSTYKDNRFLPESTVEEIENLQYLDMDYYNIYALGKGGSNQGKIYTNWEKYSERPNAPGDEYVIVNGLDFGVKKSSDALIEIAWRKGTNELYLQSKFYEKGQLSSSLTDVIINKCGNDYVFADSAESRMVMDLFDAGVNVYTPKKSVWRSIKLLKMCKLFVHKDDCWTLFEIKKYTQIKDPSTGKYLKAPVEFDDHLMKALSYGFTGLIDFLKVPIPGIAILKSKEKK